MALWGGVSGGVVAAVPLYPTTLTPGLTTSTSPPMESPNVIILEGLTLSSISPESPTEGTDTIDLYTVDGRHFCFYHEQDCCESVDVESVKGDPSHLIGSPILTVTEDITSDWPADLTKPEYQESDTWTTFTFTTAKGQVIVRWHGSSNGYYSESVSFVEMVDGRVPSRW